MIHPEHKLQRPDPAGHEDPSSERRRRRSVARGTVQGVGFRPFVYRLATGLGLAGWVNNTAQGVFIEVEGSPALLEEFLLGVQRDKPAVSTIYNLEHTVLDAAGYDSFQIIESVSSGGAGDISVPLLPDIATCPDCLRELFAPADRRYRYPFINCTHCGPRYSIVEALPYDRPNTAMKAFEMCPDCRAEYENPADRRFHAQPNACPDCGPRLEWWDNDGRVLAGGGEALAAAVDAIRGGKIVAVKGLGGFHLMVDARNGPAIKRLRERKHRDEKPFAVMMPSIEFVRSFCELSDVEEHLLLSPQAPIVLVRRGESCPTADAVAPRNPFIGVMLSYTPLHHLLVSDLGFPVVATSGNLSEEPICIDEREAVERLGAIADVFLVHNRPITRHVDDSVARVMAGRALVLRRARGFAPLPVLLRPGYGDAPASSALAVGGHLKNTVAIAHGGQLFLSQHVGDMSTVAAIDAFEKIVADFHDLYHFEPRWIACDMHPDYVTSRYAERTAKEAAACGSAIAVRPRVVRVQHHFAHVMACMAENELEGAALGVSWDGTGYGQDATVWGGEFLDVEEGRFRRAAHLRTFRLPGGDEAVKEPRRSALGLLYAAFGPGGFREDLAPVRACTPHEIEVFTRMLNRNVNAPVTSSAGRLFDAVASIVGLCQRSSYEGQAAMELEFATHGIDTDDRYRLDLANTTERPVVIDWEDMVRSIIEDVENGLSVGLISAKFHNALAEAIVDVAQMAGQERVLLSGGCFQNKYLTERAVDRLTAAGFKPYWHQRIPPNDGGIALGQLAALAAMQPRGA